MHSGSAVFVPRTNLVFFAQPIIAVAVLLAICIFAYPVSADPTSGYWARCDDLENLDHWGRIAACSNVIQSGTETSEIVAKAYGNRGVAYENLGQRDRALADYDQSVHIDSTSPSSHRFRADAYRLRRNLGEAIAEFDLALRLDPHDERALSNRGGIHLEMRQYDQAIADLNGAIAITPNFSLAFSGRCSAFIQMKDFERAIADCNEAIRLRPATAKYFYMRAVAYRLKGDLDAALTDDTEAVQLDPNYWAAFANRCWVRVLLERALPEAIADCNKALNSGLWTSVGRTALLWRGFAELKMGDFDQALRDFDMLIANEPSNAWAFYGRSVVKRKRGETDADEELAKALSIEPGIGDKSVNPLLAQFQ